MVRSSLLSYQEQFAQQLLSNELDQQSAKFLQLLQPQFGADSAIEEGELRLAIYRNNVMHSLRSALGDLYPVVKRLIGDDCFNMIAVEFIRLHPPEQAALLFYGQGLIEYLKQHPVVTDLGYLSDVAKLEFAHHIAFHSADVDGLSIEKLAGVPPEQLGEIYFTPHPSMSLIESDYAVDAIWHENIKQQPQSIDITTLGRGYILVYRAGFETQIVSLEPSCYYFLSHLSAGLSINQAWLNSAQECNEQALNLDNDELSPMLSYLLTLGVFCDYALMQKLEDSQ